MVYLDNAATTFPKPESVYRAMDEANRYFCVNVGRGSYALAKEGFAIIQDTKNLIKSIVKAKNGAEVVFTASATLAFNAVIGGLAVESYETVYVSPYEHNAVMRTLYGYQKKVGFQIKELPLEEGSCAVDLKKTAYLFAQNQPDYLFVNMVSNVTGYILPIEKLCQEAKKYSCITILDAAQALGSIPFSLSEEFVDFLVFAGHKALYGPFGIGGYIKLSGRQLQPVFFGGTGSDSLNLEMPLGIEGMEAGSPNFTAIAGFRAAILEYKTNNWWLEEKTKTELLIEKLQEVPDIILYHSPDTMFQAGIVSFNIIGFRAEEIGKLLDEDYDIAVRTGYHCAPLIHKYLQNKHYGGTVRVSIGRYTKVEDIEKLIIALKEIAEG